MAAEDIGELFKTKIPGYQDPADIQAALRLYHYGSVDYPISNTDPAQLVNPSLAHELQNLQDQIDVVDARGIGSDYLDTAPITPEDGFIWVDALSSGTGGPTYAMAVYTNEAPTTDLVDGVVWIDKDSAFKQTYVWDASISAWVKFNEFGNVIEQKGDILVGSSAGVVDNLGVGTDGQILTADSSAPLGVSWQQLDVESIEISSIMGVY